MTTEINTIERPPGFGIHDDFAFLLALAGMAGSFCALRLGRL
jgi:hypothetical protein